MMPAFVKAVLRRFVKGLAFLALIVVLLAWPARHVLEPLWPGQVEELLYLEAGGEAGRILVPAHRASVATHTKPVLARSRPASLVRVELIEGNWHHGYLLGVSSADDQSLRKDIPQELLETVAELHEPDYDMLVMACADGQRFEMAVSEIRRVIYPNRLVVTQRAQVAWQRFVDRIVERLPGRPAIFFDPVETTSLR